MTDTDTAVKDAERGKNRESEDITEVLTDGLMASFIPNMENLQGRLDELT